MGAEGPAEATTLLRKSVPHAPAPLRARVFGYVSAPRRIGRRLPAPNPRRRYRPPAPQMAGGRFFSSCEPDPLHKAIAETRRRTRCRGAGLSWIDRGPAAATGRGPKGGEKRSLGHRTCRVEGVDGAIPIPCSARSPRAPARTRARRPTASWSRSCTPTANPGRCGAEKRFKESVGRLMPSSVDAERRKEVLIRGRDRTTDGRERPAGAPPHRSGSSHRAYEQAGAGPGAARGARASVRDPDSARADSSRAPAASAGFRQSSSRTCLPSAGRGRGRRCRHCRPPSRAAATFRIGLEVDFLEAAAGGQEAAGAVGRPHRDRHHSARHRERDDPAPEGPGACR